MSRTSEAKKARRRKRQPARGASRLPASEFDHRLGTVDAAVADIDDWLTLRGWVLDADNTDVVSWFYPPSAAEFDDDDLESVTRIWITLEESDDAVVLEFGSVLVGFGAGDEPYVLDPQALADAVEALEPFRPGMPRPVLN
jgi:hypothetical protein